MSEQQYSTGASVRITGPTTPDFGRTGTIAAIHYADTDHPAYLVRFGDYCRTYGAGEFEPAHTFTPISVAELLDFLTDAIDTIRSSTAIDNAPWMRALDTAWDHILQAETLDYDRAARAWRVPSATRSGRAYTANGSCGCEAFTRGDGVCWHRAGARLIARALELRDLAAEAVADYGAEGYDLSPERARRVAIAEHAAVMAVAAEWDAAAEAEQRAARAALATLAAKVDAWQEQQERNRGDAQAEIDELFPPKLAA
jgi:hypothetical protein